MGKKVTAKRTRTRHRTADPAPPDFAINCYRRVPKSKAKQAVSPEDRAGFLGKFDRHPTERGYLAWKWKGTYYKYLGHIGTWAETWTALST